MVPTMNTHFDYRALGRSAVLLALVVLAVGCGPLRHGSAASRALLVFTNESLDQADVYAAGPDGNPIRIGTVLAGRTDTLVVPAAVTGQGGSVNIVARLLARSNTPRSGAFTLHEGEAMHVRLPPDERTLIVIPDRS